ncbi:hypothetical protein MYOV003v1_p0080 [Vibrio phage 207E48.1]|nr:hypothetical protein MYOV003v1_p0080 [Vibrio phage 207E48.1]
MASLIFEVKLRLVCLWYVLSYRCAHKIRPEVRLMYCRMMFTGNFVIQSKQNMVHDSITDHCYQASLVKGVKLVKYGGYDSCMRTAFNPPECCLLFDGILAVWDRHYKATEDSKTVKNNHNFNKIFGKK